MKDKWIWLIFVILLVGFVAGADWINPAGENEGLKVAMFFNDNTTANFNATYNFTNDVNNFNFSATPDGKFEAGFNATAGKYIVNYSLGENWEGFNEMTVEYWVRPQSGTIPVQRHHWVLGSVADYVTTYQVGTGGGKFCMQSTLKGGGSFQCRGVGLDVWTHVAVVWVNNSDMLLYLNGSLEANGTGEAGEQEDTGSGFRVGSFNGNQAGNFTLDSFLVWNTARTGEEILSDMGEANSTLGGLVTINLLIPTDSADILMGNNLNFTSELTPPSGATLANSTIQIFNENSNLIINTTQNITGTELNNSNFTQDINVGNYNWNIIGCANFSSSTVCTESGNFSFQVGLVEGTQTFNTPVVELSQQTFNANVTWNDALFNSITSTLVYNNTRYSGTSIYTQGNNVTFQKELVIPNVNSQQSESFYWEFSMTNSSGFIQFFNSSTNTQTVKSLTLGSICDATTSVLVLNYTSKDERTQEVIGTTAVQNLSVEVDIVVSGFGDASANTTLSFVKNLTNPVQVCMSQNITSGGVKLDVQTQYKSEDRVLEFHHIQNFTITNNTIPQNIDLFDLATVDSQEFLITFKDKNFALVPDALIDITRKYVSEGVFKSVEVPKTDDVGQAVGHLVLGDVIYTFVVKKQGQLLATFENIQAVCEDQSTGNCKINLNAFTTGSAITDFQTVDNLIFSFDFDSGTRDVTGFFTTIDGTTATVSLNTTLFNNATATDVCSAQLASSSGTLTCNVPATFGNVSILAELFSNGDFVGSQVFTIKATSASDAFGSTGLILVIIMFITLPMMFITEKIGVVFGAIMGLVMAGMLNLFEGGSLLGVGSTIIWFIVAGGIIIWKINTLR